MNDKKIRSLNRLLNSRAYKKASNLVAGIIESPEHTSRLIEKVNAKLGKNKSGRLHALLDFVSVCFRLLELARFTFWEKSLKTNKTEANPTQ